ncbi:MAG: hypothetical protein ACC657_12740 [Thiohalomonadales bacterium]
MNKSSKISMTNLVQISISIILTFYSITAIAQVIVNIGPRLLLSDWVGKNSSGFTYKSSYSTQVGFNIGLQKGKYYGGLSFLQGTYVFKNEGPAKGNEFFSDPNFPFNNQNVSNFEVFRFELDLIFGYYFWDNISLFIDQKVISNDSTINSYTQQFEGIGLGAAGTWPLDSRWSLFGSFGLIPSATSYANNPQNTIDSSYSVSLEFGGAYRIAENHRVNIGLKSHIQEYSYNNGASQKHRIGGLSIVYNYLIQ